jgi:anaerobic ribonucleoside-triphosphate reductase activating protein
MTAPYDPWHTGGLPFVNVAATCSATQALGPGIRAVVWVQGCPFHCPGCVAPNWIPRRITQLQRPEDLADELCARPEVTGLTFSGGEPMLQAAGLALLARYSRQQHNLSVICFTGFTLERLRSTAPGPGVAALLAEVDVLIDGLYVAARNDNRGLRGSTNQRVHYLTNRITPHDYDFVRQSRQVEIHVSDGAALLVGVPPPGLPEAFHQAVTQANTTLLNTCKGGSQ